MDDARREPRDGVPGGFDKLGVEIQTIVPQKVPLRLRVIDEGVALEPQKIGRYYGNAVAGR